MKNKPTVKLAGRFNLNYRGTECLNCGLPMDINDKYCPSCSQANSIKKLTLKDFFDEFFSTLISYDSKLLKTLTALLIKPGKITRDYIEGKRVSYTNPFRFLLSLAIIYFLMVNYSGDFEKLNKSKNEIEERTGRKIGPINFDFDNQIKQKEALAVLDSLDLENTINIAISSQEKRDSITLANPANHYKTISKKSALGRYYEKEEFFRLLLNKERVYEFSDLKKNGIPYEHEKEYENITIFNISKNIKRTINEPGTFVNYIISKLPFVIFFFLPVFTLFLWLVYIRKKYTYTDHLIFSFHNQSLFFILLIISFLIDAIFKVDSIGIFLLIFSFYLYKSMRKFYGQGRFKTIIKFIFLNATFFTLATITITLLIAGSVITF